MSYALLGPGQPAVRGNNFSNPEEFQKYLDSCPRSLTQLMIYSAVIRKSMEGVRFPANLTSIDLYQNQIYDLKGVQFPPNLTSLAVTSNGIESLEGVQFPPNLTILQLNNNQITNLARVQFPPNLRTLNLEHNQITHMNGVQFPPGLTELDLSHNKLKSFNEVKFPPGLTTLNLERNRLEMLGRIIDPSPNVLSLIEVQFPKIIEEFRKNLARQSQQPQQADSKFASDSTQKSMVTMLKTLTAFFREGMEARARQHEEQVKKDNEERGKQIFFARGSTGKTYPVPLNTTMTIQAVLDYLNSHYYISALEDCGVMHLIFSGQRLEPERTLADYNVQAESTLNLVCKFRPNLFQGGSKKRRPKKSKKHYKIRRNKSMKK